MTENETMAIARWKLFLSAVLVRSECLKPEGHPYNVDKYVKFYYNELAELDYKIMDGFNEMISPLDKALLKDELRFRLREND